MTEFRAFIPADQTAVLQLMHDFYTIDNYPFDSKKAENLFQTFVSQPQLGQGFVILSDGEIAGYMILTYFFSFEFGGRMALFDELYIAADFRGKSLGKLAMEFGKQVMKELDIVGYYLEVEPHNEVAKKLYLAQGFKNHAREFMRFTPMYNT